jgi:hypothetical protein
LTATTCSNALGSNATSLYSIEPDDTISHGLADKEDVQPWPQLLRGTHAFSLQASEPISLYHDDRMARECRHRIKNAGWRRWWMEQHLNLGIFRSTKPEETPPPTPLISPRPAETVISTPTNSPPTTPRSLQALLGSPLQRPMEAPVEHIPPYIPLSPAVQYPSMVYRGLPAPSTPVVLVPVPLHLAAPVQQYAEDLQFRPSEVICT